MDIIKKLPEDLRKYILAFTYEPQPYSLLSDIQHYTRTRPIIQEWYTNRFAWEYPNAENDWLNNDLIGFCNDHYATMYGYRDNFISIFARLFYLKNKSRQQIITLCRKVFRRDEGNNITWGLLTIEERENFISHWEI